MGPYWSSAAARLSQSKMVTQPDNLFQAAWPGEALNRPAGPMDSWNSQRAMCFEILRHIRIARGISKNSGGPWDHHVQWDRNAWGIGSSLILTSSKALDCPLSGHPCCWACSALYGFCVLPPVPVHRPHSSFWNCLLYNPSCQLYFNTYFPGYLMSQTNVSPSYEW